MSCQTGAADSGAVCEALREDEKSHYIDRRGDRGGCRTVDHALCADQDQLGTQSLQRVRKRWVMRRTAVIKQIRSNAASLC